MAKQILLFLFVTTLSGALSAQSSVLDFGARVQKDMGLYTENGTAINYLARKKEEDFGFFCIQTDPDTTIQSETRVGKPIKKYKIHNDEVATISWMSVGYGTGNLGYTSFGGNISGELRDNWLATLGVQGNELKNNSSQGSLDVMTGKIFSRKVALFTLSTGFSLVVRETAKLSTSNNREYDDRFTVGIPVLVQGYLMTFQNVAIGLNGYANFNTIHTSTGVTISMALLNVHVNKKQRAPITYHLM